MKPIARMFIYSVAVCLTLESSHAEQSVSPLKQLQLMAGQEQLPTVSNVPKPVLATAKTVPADGSIITGIKGIVTIGPICAGPAQPDKPCPDKPYPNATITIWQRGGYGPGHCEGCRLIKIATVHSDAKGEFMLPLSPEGYIVIGESEPGHPYPRGSSEAVGVIHGELTWVNIKYDTGIR